MCLPTAGDKGVVDGREAVACSPYATKSENNKQFYKKKPGAGNGGILQLSSAGKVSILVGFKAPPVIIKPDLGIDTIVCRTSYQLIWQSPCY